MFSTFSLLSLLITVLFQITIQRDLEKLTGWFEMAVLYLGGGVVGSMASAIFIPYYVEVLTTSPFPGHHDNLLNSYLFDSILLAFQAGPSGSQFAVIAAMFVEVLRWNKDENPWKTLGKIFLVLIILFFLGAVVSQIDNYSHLFGLIFGIFIAYGFRPYKSYKGEMLSRACLIITRIVSFALAVAIFSLVTALFYAFPVYSCDACMYFNCIPFTDTYCEGMSVSISRESSNEATTTEA